MAEGTARVIAGRYRLTDRLGSGGMGVVWRAHDVLLGRDVALKEIHGPHAGDLDPAVRRTLREARAAARLRHRGIVTVHDVVTSQGRPWIVMELIRGRSLDESIAADGPLPPASAAAVALEVLDALGAAHGEGILHRDVKPANILLAGDRAVLTDFGIAAIDGATGLTGTGVIIGSPEYLAPERISGLPATAAADLWGLGVTLYAALTGRSPFHREDTRTTLAAVLASDPERVDGPMWPVVRGLLEKDPERRLTAAGAMPMLTALAEPPPPGRARAFLPGRARPDDVSPLPAPLAVTPQPQPEKPTRQENPPQQEASPQEKAPQPRPAMTEVDTPPARRRPLAVRAAEVLVAPLLAVLLLAVAVWLGERRSETPAAGQPPPSVVASNGRAVAASSKPWSPPAPPRGYVTVTGAGYTVAVPRDWSASFPAGWQQGPANRLADPLVKLEISRSPRRQGVTARSLLADDGGKRPLRRTDLPVIAGAGSVSEAEYATARTQPAWGHRREIDRIVVISAGTASYTIVVRVWANSAADLRRGWARYRPVLVRILGTFRLTPVA